METQEVQTENTELAKIVNESGLQLNEAETIKQSYLPYFNQIGEIKEQAMKINFENPTELDEKIARELRLRTVKIRTGSQSVKEERKRIHMLKANVEQSAWNLIKTTCELDEERFLQVEKKREIEEKLRKDNLKKEREAELQPYFEGIIPSVFDLGNITESDYVNFLSGAKLQHQAKIDAEKKLAEEKLAIEKAEAEERERIKAENERLKAEAEAKEKELAKERWEAEKEKEAMEAKIKAEQKERERLLAEIKAKADAEEKAKKEAEAKVAADLKAKELAEKKAKKAPDKEKLNDFANTLDNLAFPDIKSAEAKQVLESAKGLLQKVSAYLREKSENI